MPTGSNGRAADKAAQPTGKARRTLDKAEAIVDAVEAEPARFGKLLADMDRIGRVNGLYKRLLISELRESVAEPQPFVNFSRLIQRRRIVNFLHGPSCIGKAPPCIQNSRLDLARTGIGIDVRKGAPKPDVSTLA